MGTMEEWDFRSAADFAAFGAPDFPDVHREWVRREWVSGSQGLVNQHGPSGRIGVPRLYDYGGVGHCMLLPNVPYQVCEPAYGHLAPTGVVMGTEDQTQSTDNTPADQAQQAGQQQNVSDTAPAVVVPSAPVAVKAWGAVMGIALAGIVAAILL